MKHIRVLRAAFILQMALSKRSVDSYMMIIIAPITCVMLLLVFSYTGRADLAPLAVVAAGVMAAFQGCFFYAGDLLSDDRSEGNLEMLITSQANLFSVMMGRLCASSVFNSIAIIECLVVGYVWSVVTGYYGFNIGGVREIAIAAVASIFILTGTVAPFAPLALLTRAVRIYQNALPWAVILLSGVLVPVDYLPAWLQPAALCSPLYWLSSGLRKIALGAPEGSSLYYLFIASAIACIGICCAALFTKKVLERLRRSAEGLL